MSGQPGPYQIPLRAKYRVGRRWGYKSRHNDSSPRTRRKGSKTQPVKHSVPLLVDGRRIVWLRGDAYETWLATH